MKKVSLILLLISVLALCVGCEKNDDYIRERFYGVVKRSEEFERLVVYVPDIGEVEIPEAEGCCAGFDGYEENESNSYQLKEGDFVAISFKYKKSWDDSGVAIMESYPARFDRKANLIEALKENVCFEKNDNGYELSIDLKDKAEAFTEGDKIYFVNNSGKNGVAYKELIAEGVITDISSGIATSKLEIKCAEKEFFKKLAFATIEERFE